MRRITPTPGINENDLAIIERTDYASQAISKGAYVHWNGKLRTAKAAILQGAELSASLFDDVDSDGGALNQIKEKLTPEDISSDISGVSSVTFDSKIVFKVGKIVIANIRFKTSLQITGNSAIMTGFPSASGNAYVKCSVLKVNGSQSAVVIQPTGTLANDWGTISANTDYFLNIAYTTN